jgi:hypothetical protein
VGLEEEKGASQTHTSPSAPGISTFNVVEWYAAYYTGQGYWDCLQVRGTLSQEIQGKEEGTLIILQMLHVRVFAPRVAG